MKALSVKHPYADAIANGHKVIEFRGWKTEHRGDLLIVASLGFESGTSDYLRERLRPTLGHAICVVELVDIHGERHDYRWRLRNARRVKPFPVKGKIFTYDVPDRLIRLVSR
jgi:hypothetical protein